MVSPAMTRAFGIIGAFVVAGIMVGTAYVLSGPSFLSAGIAGAISTDALLAEYAAKDSDNDQLPDWQEQLYGTDPLNPRSVQADLLDGEAVARGLVAPKFEAERPADTVDLNAIPGTTPAKGSLTEQFARAFFEKFMTSWNGSSIDEAQKQALLANLLADFTARARAVLDSRYTLSDVRSSPSVTVSEYAASVEALIENNDVPEDAGSPVLLMDSYIQKNDLAAKKNLETLSASYANIARGLAAVAVPTELVDEHLSLLRAFDMLAKATGASLTYEDDPIAVLGAIGIYGPASQEASRAFIAIGDVIIREGRPAAGAPGSLIVETARFAREQGL